MAWPWGVECWHHLCVRKLLSSLSTITSQAKLHEEFYFQLIIFLLKHSCLLVWQMAFLSYTVGLFDWLIFISGVYPLGCYQRNFFRTTLLSSITGSNIIQQCISAAAARSTNFQGIGIMKTLSKYNCYADSQADLRYSQYSLKKCSSRLNAANETVAFLFTGITIHNNSSIAVIHVLITYPFIIRITIM